MRRALRVLLRASVSNVARRWGSPGIWGEGRMIARRRAAENPLARTRSGEGGDRGESHLSFVCVLRVLLRASAPPRQMLLVGLRPSLASGEVTLVWADR